MGTRLISDSQSSPFFYYLIFQPHSGFKDPKRQLSMTIFGKLRNARKFASEHKSGKPAPADSQPKPTPYKHIPTHAASDSLACAPPGWKQIEDWKYIQAQRKRRSEMRRSTSGLSVVTTLYRGDSYNTDDWTATAIHQRNSRPPMPVMPGPEAIRRLSPLHASGDHEASSINDLH
jgi:hypothetical protein